MFLMACPHFCQVADDGAGCVASGAHSGVSCDVLAPWNSTASDPTASAVHDSALTQQPLNTVRIPTWGGSLGGRCSSERAVLIPPQKAVPDFSVEVPPTLCLRLPGDPRQRKPPRWLPAAALHIQKMHHFPVRFATVCHLYRLFFSSFWFN